MYQSYKQCMRLLPQRVVVATLFFFQNDILLLLDANASTRTCRRWSNHVEQWYTYNVRWNVIYQSYEQDHPYEWILYLYYLIVASSLPPPHNFKPKTRVGLALDKRWVTIDEDRGCAWEGKRRLRVSILILMLVLELVIVLAFEKKCWCWKLEYYFHAVSPSFVWVLLSACL